MAAAVTIPFFVLQFILGLHEVPIPVRILTKVNITVLNTLDNKSTVPLYN